jgi:quercetin dioxygenase-like cupin family protein
MESRIGISIMHRLLFACAFLLSFTASVSAQEQAKVTTLFSRDLSDIPGKEGLMLIVEYPPGGTDPIHRHDANAFIYVLEGSIIMQLKGAAPVTLHPGQTFYEGPNDVHLVGRNASNTESAEVSRHFRQEQGRAHPHTGRITFGANTVPRGGSVSSGDANVVGFVLNHAVANWSGKGPWIKLNSSSPLPPPP